MIDVVLQRLEALRTELSCLDPAQEIDAADQVAAMARALRDVLAHAERGRREDAGAAGEQRRRTAG